MEEIKQNKMGTMPIGKLVLNMSIPMIVSMLVQALYNIVDSVFVAQINEDALSAVSLAFPIQTLIIAFAAGTGVGVNALVSKALGEKNNKFASSVATNSAIIYVFNYILFLILGLTIVGPFYFSQVGDTTNRIYRYGIDYLSIVMVLSVGVFTQIYFERLLVSTGKTFYAMLSQSTGAIINIIFDPILIFGLLGFPKLGVAGAAIATIFGQCVASCIGAFCHFKYNHEIKISLKGFKPNATIIKNIYAIGIPSIIMQSIGSVMTYSMNKILIGFTSTATAVFGVYFKLQSFFFMPVFGLNNGITPIVAFNYGARNKNRMLHTIKFSMKIAICFMLIGFISFEAFPGILLRIFDASKNMLFIGIPALRIIGIHFLIAWYCIVIGSVFQALGKAWCSMIVSIMRQLVVLIPVAFILAKFGGLNAVWWSFPIAELMSAIVTTICYMWIYKKIIKKI